MSLPDVKLGTLIFGLLLIQLASATHSSRCQERARPPPDVVISASEILPEDGRGAQPDCAHQSPEAEGVPDELRAEQNSQLLLRLLVVGLLALVSISLAVVYSIKFCLCRRRKFRRANLVADCQATCRPGNLQHLDCLCARPDALALPSLCLVGPRSRHPAAHGMELTEPRWLGLARPSPPQAPSSGQSSSCSSCLNGPPSYADLFGYSQPGANEANRNLLVKLNLNKIQLLSADDLLLLSRLIDVPIVVHEPRQADPLLASRPTEPASAPEQPSSSASGEEVEETSQQSERNT